MSQPFDAAVQESHGWIADVMQETGLEEEAALAALRGVLRALRDEVPPDRVKELSSQMPVLIRGFYFEGWEPRRIRRVNRDPQRFLDCVRSYGAFNGREIDAERLVREVLRVIERRMPGPAQTIKHGLPKELRALWTSTEGERDEERRDRLAEEKRTVTYDSLHAESGHERGAPLAPHHNRPPSVRHRGGPLPNMKK